MTKLQDLIQDAPDFASMERGELVAHAYGMFAAGTKADAKNAKLRKLCNDMWTYITEPVSKRHNLKERFARFDDIGDRMAELGLGVDE